MAYPATPKTWVAGDVLTAAQLNAELRDALLGAFPLGPPDVAWTGYTPTLAQGATGNIAKTVTYARYTRVGRLIVVAGLLAVTGTGTAAAGVSVTLPVAATASAPVLLPVMGTAFIYDVSATTYYPGFPKLESATVMSFLPGGTTIGLGWQSLGQGGGVAAGTFGAALANGDTVAFSAVYESAT
jgi:hypothetical protein